MTQKRSRIRIAAAMLGGMFLFGSAGAGVMYWQFFRKDPQFLKQKAQSDETQKTLDDIFDEDNTGELP